MRVRLDKRTREAIRAKRAENRETVTSNLSTPWVRPIREIVNVTRSGIIRYGRVDSTLMVRGMVERKTKMRMDRTYDPRLKMLAKERTQKDKEQSRALRAIGEFGQCDRRSDFELRQASSLGVTVVEE